MALLQANKDLICAGMKEFSALLDQQVRPSIAAKDRPGVWRGGRGQGRRVIWSWESSGGVHGNNQRQGPQIPEERTPAFVGCS